jgi:hypothetical protein
VLGGRLHRGAAGAAGEIGYLQVPGAPVLADVRDPTESGLQWLAGLDMVRALSAEYGFAASSAAESVRAAGGAELARRIAAEVIRRCLARPRILPTEVPSEPVLRGALLAAVDHARADLLTLVSA